MQNCRKIGVAFRRQYGTFAVPLVELLQTGQLFDGIPGAFLATVSKIGQFRAQFLDIRWGGAAAISITQV